MSIPTHRFRISTFLALAVLAALTGPSTGSAVAATGQIVGVVTDQTTGQPVANVEVDVYKSGSESVPMTTVHTQGNGSYDVTGLTTGSYKISFSQLRSNYLARYYKNAETAATATPIEVTNGNTTSGIDQALPTAGQISGTLTYAGTNAPAAGSLVEAWKTGNEGTPEGFAETTANGTYTMSGLQTGTYRIGFNSPSPEYEEVFYKEASSLATATPITVTAGTTTNSINATLPKHATSCALVDPGCGGGPPIEPLETEIKRWLSRLLLPVGRPATISAILRVGGYTTFSKAIMPGRTRVSWYLRRAHLAGKTRTLLVATGGITQPTPTLQRLTVKLTPFGKRTFRHARHIVLTGVATLERHDRAPVAVTSKFTLRR